MPSKKNSNATRQLEKQITELKKQLAAVKKELANGQAKHAQAVKEAADIGYEMGLLDAEEREISRAKVVAEAIARFEKKHTNKPAKKSIVAKKKPAAKKVKAKVKAKPAKVVKPAKKIVVKAAKPKPVQQPAVVKEAEAFEEVTQNEPAEIV